MIKTTKNLVGAGVTLAAGNAVIGAIPGGEKVMPMMNKAANMMGPLTTAAYAKETMNIMSDIPKGYHKMPDGSLMKDNDMPKKQKQGWGW